MDALPPLQTTALDSTPASLPARRPSRKKSHAHAHALPEPRFSEKYSDSPTSSNNPFHDMHAIPLPPQGPITDLEAQDPEHVKLKHAKKGRRCMIIACVFVLWVVFMFGLILFTNTVFPGAVVWRRLKDLKMEMVGTEQALESLKGKVGEMLRYMETLGGETLRGNWTTGGTAESEFSSGLENGTMDMGEEGM